MVGKFKILRALQYAISYNCRKFCLAFLQTNKTSGRTCLVATCLFFNCSVKFVLLLNHAAKHKMFHCYVVIIVLDSFREQCIVFLFFALEYEV